ncbi:hypothetical protein GH714_031597 [Hevea brasiliensis]|uniref:Uncharacterized protein n=1 Tax=Hevea brasiliensis TaxID=3981 RepID=A0A6A6L171_HEVBR|nr:hypothetical protein GH714_031597 [Hevea brasiliensis]
MGRMEYLKMSTDQVQADLIKSDLNELKVAAKRLINDATRLGGLGFGTSFLKWVASFAAILAGDARIIDTSSGCGSQFLRAHLEGQLGWCLDMPLDWLLPTARAHQGIWWIQKLLHTIPWNIKHCWHYLAVGLPSMGTGTPLHLGDYNSPMNWTSQLELEQSFSCLMLKSISKI